MFLTRGKLALSLLIASMPVSFPLSKRLEGEGGYLMDKENAKKMGNTVAPEEIAPTLDRTHILLV